MSAQTQTSTAATSGIAKSVTVPNSRLYALTGDDSLHVLEPGATSYVRGGRVDVSDGGNLIGIDSRPADVVNGANGGNLNTTAGQ